MKSFDSFEDLQDKPYDRAIEVPLNGNNLPWLPSLVAGKRAERQGVSLGEIMEGLTVLQKLEEADEGDDVQDMFKTLDTGVTALAKLVWYGYLTFKPDLDLDTVLQHIDFNNFSQLPIEQMVEKLQAEDPDSPNGEDSQKKG